MLHRVKKENDLNHDKWIGVGGRFERDESPEECLLREVREETGLILDAWRFRGVVTFISDRWETEYMYLFTADRFHGLLTDCDEGVLEWVDRERVPALPLWEGDKIFLRLLEEDAPPFLLTLKYRGDTLIYASLDGKTLITEE
jgi:8-oxo-dGTP diphosphatase